MYRMTFSHELVRKHLRPMLDCSKRNGCINIRRMLDPLTDQVNYLQKKPTDREVDGSILMQVATDSCSKCTDIDHEKAGEASILLLGKIRNASKVMGRLTSKTATALQNAQLRCLQSSRLVPVLENISFPLSEGLGALGDKSQGSRRSEIERLVNRAIDSNCGECTDTWQLRAIMIDEALDYVKEIEDAKNGCLPNGVKPEPRKEEPLFLTPLKDLADDARRNPYYRRFRAEVREYDGKTLASNAHRIVMDYRVLELFGLNQYFDRLNGSKGDQVESLRILNESDLAGKLEELNKSAKTGDLKEFVRQVRFMEMAGILNSGSACVQDAEKARALEYLARAAGYDGCRIGVLRQLQQIERIFPNDLCAGERWLLDHLRRIL